MIGDNLIWVMIAWGVAGGSPGPATLAIAGTSMGRGRRAGLSVALGILAGSASWGIAAALGLSALMIANAWLVDVLRYCGAAYLIFLAFKALRSAASNKPMMLATTSQGSAARLFTKGLLIHLTNPKAIFAWGAIFSIVVPSGSSFGEVLRVFASLFAISTTVFIGYAILFSAPSFARAYQNSRRWFETTFALMFGYAGFKILTAKII